METEINKTQAAIQSFYKEPIATFELAEAERRLVGFMKLLVKIDHRNKRQKQNENHQS